MKDVIIEQIVINELIIRYTVDLKNINHNARRYLPND